jgi:hypothetical protein
MNIGSTEAFVFYFVILVIAVFIWSIILRLFRVKSMAIACALGYATLAAFAVVKGWNPLISHAFDRGMSEAVVFSWPAVLLAKYLKVRYYFLVLCAGVLQYCALGWVIDMLAGSVLGEE